MRNFKGEWFSFFTAKGYRIAACSLSFAFLALSVVVTMSFKRGITMYLILSLIAAIAHVVISCNSEDYSFFESTIDLMSPNTTQEKPLVVLWMQGEDKVYSNTYNGFTSIYELPTTVSSKVGSLRNGQQAIVVETTGVGWTKIKARDKEGYVPNKFLQKERTHYVPSDITKEFLSSYWENGSRVFLVFSNGCFCECEKDDYGQFTMTGYGLWSLDNMDIILDFVENEDYFDDRLIFTINLPEAILKNKSGYSEYKKTDHIEYRSYTYEQPFYNRMENLTSRRMGIKSN